MHKDIRYRKFYRLGSALLVAGVLLQFVLLINK